MALLGSNFTNDVGLRLLLCPLGSNVVVRTACSVGIVLPVYSTFKAIERKDNREQQRWLLYWAAILIIAAYGSFSLVEVFQISLFLANVHNGGYAYKTVGYIYVKRVPMYYHMKFAFLVWLQLPSVDLYMSHLRPFFLRHLSRIDPFLGLAYGEMVKLISSHKEEIQYARAVLLKIMGSGEKQPRQTNAIESRRATISDVESDHVHDD